MSRLAPIPTPIALQWREFRIRFLPFIVFAAMTVATGVLWNRSFTPVHMVGEVDASRADVISPKVGILVELKVHTFDEVVQGQEVGRVMVDEPGAVTAALDVVRAEIELLRTGLSPLQTQQRVLLDYERLHLDYMIQRVEMTSASVDLQLAEADFLRQQKLFQGQVISESEFQIAQRIKEARQQQVNEIQRLVTETGARLQNLPVTNSVAGGSTNSALQAAIDVEEKKLKQIMADAEPIILHAPMSGVVTAVSAKKGETVAERRSILTISASKSNRIVAYVKQPISITPRPGMAVLIRSRRGSRERDNGTIIKVGTTLEPIAPSFWTSGAAREGESGLPVQISLPTTLKLLPGELVDLTLN